MDGATDCQLATRAVSLMWVAEVKPKPPLAMELKSWMLSDGVKVVFVHCSCKLTVIWSSWWAVVGLIPMVRAVKVASLAVAVRHNA